MVCLPGIRAGRSYRGITREVFQVAGAEGVTLQWESPEEYLAYLKNDLIPVMATHTSSMLQDISCGRRTEVGFMNGAITRFGEKHGIATPYNECLTNIVQFRSRNRWNPGVFEKRPDLFLKF